MTYQTMLKKSLTNPELEEALRNRLGANFKRVQRLAKLQKEARSAANGATGDEQYRLAIELLREDKGGWIQYGQSNPMPGDPWNLAHRLMEQFMEIRSMSEDEENCEEAGVEPAKLLEDADEFYYAAEYLTWLADGFVDMVRSIRE